MGESAQQKRVRVVVTGRVQGVFFRASTQDEAKRLCLCGWVRNLADGSVETEFQGEVGAVRRMTNWLQHGSSSARVDSMEIAAVDLAEEHSFRVIVSDQRTTS